jgi:galactose-1-phosphate uridylyltransferase
VLPSIEARLREGECEVCLKDVQEFIDQLKNEKSEEKIESGIKKICKKYTNKADKRFCYYIGGSEDAATSLLRTLSVPMKNHMPVEKICEKLKKADGQICQVKYEKPPKPIDWATVDFNKMRVKELRDILTNWQEKCDGCTEKGDYIRKIKEVLPKYINKKEL